MRLQLKLTLALLATVALGAVVQLCVAEDTKQASYYRDDEHHHHPSAPSAGDNDKHHAQGDAYAGDDKATPLHAKHIYVDAPAPALGQSYNIPVLRRTMPWPEGTTLAQLAAQALLPRQALKRGAEEQRALRERVLGAVRTRLAVTNHKRGWQGKRQAPAGQARRGDLDAVQAEPLGHYGEYEHYGGPHAHVERSFTGLTAFDDTNPATGGNTIPSTPPSPGLCVGNGFILETVNNVLRVSSEDGRPLTTPLTLNAFGGYPPDLDTATDEFGPDPYSTSCWFDTKARRWWHVMAVYGVNVTTGDLTGDTWVDVTVSTSSDPRGTWRYYRIPTTNNGADGTPNLECESSFCRAGRPQMAVWDQALVITANNYDTFYGNFYGPLVYTLDKEALVQGLAAATTILINPGTNPDGTPLLNTLVAARQSSACELRNEFLMGTPSTVLSGLQVDTLQLLRLRGTASIGTDHPHVTLEWVDPGVKLPFQYSEPPNAVQKSGVIPLGTREIHTTDVSLLSAGGAVMASLSFVDDKLYAAWGTAVEGVAGAAWALVDPQRPARALDSGLISMPGGNNLVYPYLAVRAGGEGVMALSVSGPDYFPSPAYALLTRHGVGRVKLIANGVGPLDDISGYDSDRVARFGAYAAALVDETGAFWLASEWVAQSCSVVEYNIGPTCGGTRNEWTNWATRVSKVVVD